MTMLSEIKLSHQDALRVADERLKETIRVADERLKDAAERLKETSRVADERLKDAAERLVESKASSAVLVANALYDLDVAHGRLNVRSVYEDAIAMAWVKCAPPGVRVAGVTARVDALLTSKTGLQPYLRVAAEDNGVSPDKVVEEARKLYASLCSRAHLDAPAGTTTMHMDVFDGARTQMIAYAASLAFGERHIAFYVREDGERAILPLVLRAERGCAATEAAIRASLKLVGGGRTLALT
jgi:hypothetical protein